MDPAVGLVQAYLRVNGFFTVTEYPVVVRSRGGSATLTDVDILAIRFPGAGRWVPEPARGGAMLPSDSRLAVDDDHLHMIIGEVKEGKAKLNESAYSLAVIETVIRRFGCCRHDPAATARLIVNKGAADTPAGNGMPCRIRMMVFSGSYDGAGRRFQAISLKHVTEFLRQHLDRNRDVFLQTQIKEESLALLALFLKIGARQ